jgi:phospholipase C
MGSNIAKVIATDPNPAADLLDVQQDILEIAAFDRPVEWGWYQQGFNSNDALDPYEKPGTPTAPTNKPDSEQRLCPASQCPAVYRLFR